MRSSLRRIAILLVLVPLVLAPRTVHCQGVNTTRVIVLPFPRSEATDPALARELFDAFRGGMRRGLGIAFADSQETARLLKDKAPVYVLSGTDHLYEFATASNADFVVGGYIERRQDGGLDVGTLVYSREERRLRVLEERRFGDEAEAVRRVPMMAREISHPRFFSPSDTPLIYSMLIPGMGQLAIREPLHGLATMGLVASAAVYGLSTPTPDTFALDFRDYSSEFDPVSGGYDYYIKTQSVTEAEFFAALNADRAHHFQAAGERRAASVRKRRAAGLFAAAYLFNLMDTIVLTRRSVDGGSFFMRLGTFMEAGDGGKWTGAGLHLRFLFP